MKRSCHFASKTPLFKNGKRIHFFSQFITNDGKLVKEPNILDVCQHFVFNSNAGRRVSRQPIIKDSNNSASSI